MCQAKDTEGDCVALSALNKTNVSSPGDQQDQVLASQRKDFNTRARELQQATKFYLKVRVHMRDTQMGSLSGACLNGSSS